MRIWIAATVAAMTAALLYGAAMIAVFALALLWNPTIAKAQLAEEVSCPHAVDWRPKNLAGILDAHKAWLIANGEPGLRDEDVAPTAEPAKANLCRSNLIGEDLQEATLIAANLQGANLDKANLQGASLQDARLQGASLYEANLQDANLDNANLQGASLLAADLQGAVLVGARLQGASLFVANLQGADLRSAYLQRSIHLRFASLRRANLFGVDLGGLDLSGAQMEGTDLRKANLEGANLTDANLQDARLLGASIAGSTFSAFGAPNKNQVDLIEGLAQVSFKGDQHSAFVLLRKALQDAGLRDRERQATYSLERHKTAQLKGMRFASKIEAWLRIVFFDWTTKYGLEPNRAIFLIAVLIAVSSVFYLYPIADPRTLNRRSGVVRTTPPGHIETRGQTVRTSSEERAEWLILEGWKVYAYAFYFSLLSAFHIGWRDLNVGSWLTKLQPAEFALRGRGWVRVTSGIQSLLTVYLLAIWALTYFGRPFQ